MVVISYFIQLTLMFSVFVRLFFLSNLLNAHNPRSVLRLSMVPSPSIGWQNLTPTLIELDYINLMRSLPRAQMGVLLFYDIVISILSPHCAKQIVHIIFPYE